MAIVAMNAAIDTTGSSRREARFASQPAQQDVNYDLLREVDIGPRRLQMVEEAKTPYSTAVNAIRYVSLTDNAPRPVGRRRSVRRT